jgi:hypothetical protein
MKWLGLLFVTSYLEIVPGTSTTSDVERVLGPARSVDGAIHEYAAQRGTGPIKVEFGGTPNVVDRIEVPFLKPVRRAALLSALSLPEPVGRDDSKGKLIEYFGSSVAVALAYAGADEASGIIGMEYFSRPVFERRFESVLAGEKKISYRPADCRDLYEWAGAQEKASRKDAKRLATVLQLRILAQRGDCQRARPLAEQLGFK